MGNLKVKKAIIPAAGFGTRFLPATKAIPKEMLPIIDIPTIQYIVEECIDSGIEEILIIDNDSKQEIRRHFSIDERLEKKLISHDLYIKQSTEFNKKLEKYLKKLGKDRYDVY